MIALLREHPLRHGELRQVAAHIGVSVRTLYTWLRRGGQSGRPGRPRHPDAQRRAARETIEPLWRELPKGHDGERTLCALLRRRGTPFPLRLVREIVQELKAQAAQDERERLAANRVSATVLVRDAVWSLDQMQIARDARGSVYALTLSDGFALRVLAISLGPPACGRDVVRLLEHAARERGCWPLVLQMDNGPENRNAEVLACLREHEVIALWNEPHTPQHNARAERVNGDLQRASGLGGACRLLGDATQGPVCALEPGFPATRLECAQALARAAWQLDACTPRAARGDLTPCELDRTAPRAEDRVCRGSFCREVRQELERVALDAIGARARRKQEREIIWSALVRHGMVHRTRGGLPVPAFKSEGVS